MATGTVTAREPQKDTKTETKETSTAQPETFKGRMIRLLHEIFHGREEHLGWHQ